MKKIILAVVVLIILGFVGYGIFVKKVGAPPLPNILPLLSPVGSLQGVWGIKEVYIADPATGEFKLQPPGEKEKYSYLEFKGDMTCMDGRLDYNRKPYPCSTYQPFSISGDTIKIEDPSRPMTLKWKRVSGNFELTFESTGQRVKVVLTEL